MKDRHPHTAPTITRCAVNAYTIPTDAPESDGTIEWDRTTAVVVRVTAGAHTGLGYTYADMATAGLIQQKLAPLLKGRSAFDVAGAYVLMRHQVRNLGKEGICAMAISAVDVALWDLKARILGLPLVSLLGAVREKIPAYGSGGFTSYSDNQIRDQLGGWAASGIRMVKMKIGREPERDPARVRVAREAIGRTVQLFVDANGAFDPRDAVAMAHRIDAFGVTWFEEPVSSDDLEGLRFVRDHAPRAMAVAAGEYGYDGIYFEKMLAARSVDVLQADATRCGGVTGFLQAQAICDAHGVPLSAHTSPSIHAHLCCAASRARHVEYFHDHVRVEGMLFDGAIQAANGDLEPNLGAPGLGLSLKEADAERWAA